MAALPMAGEIWDGEPNDIDGLHIRAQHAITAIERARGSPLAQSAVDAERERAIGVDDRKDATSWGQAPAGTG